MPLKLPTDRKTRLASRLPPARREALSDLLFAHVTATLRLVPEISEIMLLAPARMGWPGSWEQDIGRGLNRELQAVQTRHGARRLLVVHADLPLVSPDDIAVCLARSEGGQALAPDRHDTGTNAIALGAGKEFTFAFGPDSFTAHRRAAGPQAAIVRCPGLSLDIDTPEDLDLALAAGFQF